jgi:hypothetical protein
MTNKDDYWFTHDAGAHTDIKIEALMLRYGVAGYGMFWIVIEVLRRTDGYKLKTKGYIWSALAKKMMCTPEQSQEFVTACIEEFDLFQSDGEHFWSESLNRRMEAWEEKKRAKQAAGQKGGLAKAGRSSAKAVLQQEDSSAIAEPSSAKAVPEQNVARIEQDTLGDKNKTLASLVVTDSGHRHDEPVDNSVDNADSTPELFHDDPEPEPQAAPAKPPSEHQQLVDAAMSLHQQATGTPYAFSGEDGKHLQQVRKKLGFDEAMTRLRRYYTGEYWFTEDGQYSIRQFHRHVNELAANGAIASPTPEDREAARKAYLARMYPERYGEEVAT